jgi:predicted metal-dependent HD superfamily phosphohydrolase
MNYATLLEKVKEHMLQFFSIHESTPLLFHNRIHTQKVVSHASEIARHYQLNDRDFFIVLTAAWFHDAGYYLNGGTQHEMAGANMAAEFLKQLEVDDATITAVQNCIIATMMPQQPSNLLEEIICDADLYHFGTADFDKMNKCMRKEASLRRGIKIPKPVWRLGTIALLENHEYKTEYARQLLNETKKENLDLLKSKPEADKEEDEKQVKDELKEAKTAPQEPEKEPTEKAAKKQKDNDRPNRGIETMFRISSNNHQRLSDMADNKAHIMVTTTSIILSVLLSVLLRKLEDNPHLIFPTILLLLVCVVTMVFAILATRPSLPKGIFTEEDIEKKKVNLLFFGNFFRMSYDEYSRGMNKMMDDREFLYGSLTRDIYSQGIVLGHKYRLLRVAYNIFMYGVVASVLSFVLAATIFAQ